MKFGAIFRHSLLDMITAFGIFMWWWCLKDPTAWTTCIVTQSECSLWVEVILLEIVMCLLWAMQCLLWAMQFLFSMIVCIVHCMLCRRTTVFLICGMWSSSFCSDSLRALAMNKKNMSTSFNCSCFTRLLNLCKWFHS